ncbi:hypothetical protein FRC03_009176 [Tulasnella sp. 419]|nr:hypothetical protein FRC03_009176 [Tulasnella sp. 419]
MQTDTDISHLDLTNKVEFGEQCNYGGYSDIFQGIYSEDDGNRLQVAIKALRVQGPSGTPGSKERLMKHFYREILLWKRFQHPNIVPLLGCVLLDHKPPALVSLWYHYGNVLSYLQQHEDADRHSLALDVGRGLEYLHTFPVAHGDLKGENVLVNTDGNAVLCDFGMSQFLDEASHIAGFTTTNANIGGTDRYMSPELLEGEPRSTATDMWALGCLVLQILSDEIPYQRMTRKHEVLSAILRKEAPSKTRPEVMNRLIWDYIRKCWSVAPQDRPQVTDLCSLFLRKNAVNYLYIVQRKHSSISGNWTVCPSLPVPWPYQLRGENLRLEASSFVAAKVDLVGEGKARIGIESRHNGVYAEVRERGKQKFRLRAYACQDVRIRIPRDFAGPVKLYHRHGYASTSYSPDIYSNFRLLDSTEKETTGWIGAGYEQQSLLGWEGDELIVWSKKGHISLFYGDEA